MKYIENFIKYKTIYNKINAIDNWYPYGSVITNKKKIERLKKMEDIDINVDKYLKINFALRKSFWLWNIMDSKSLDLYYSFDQWVKDNKESYYREILIDSKKIIPFSLDDRDKFIELFPLAGFKIWSVLVPEINELLLSIDNNMEMFKKITRSNILLELMGGFEKLKGRLKCLIIEK